MTTSYVKGENDPQGPMTRSSLNCPDTKQFPGYEDKRRKSNSK